MKSKEFEKFDVVMDGLLTVPKSELQRKLDDEKRAKERKKRPVKTASSRVSASGKRRAR
ncbi:MAG TPA: hypothetical protein VE863_22085 [Pyrinomonadaceae bacterium]|jgi:hypothetical protein|nr:hypothetical protein [Pyrinomonadaceae bacterium]